MMARLAICVIMASLCFTAAGCERSGAASEVKNDLEAIQTNSSAERQLGTLRSVVSKDTGKNIDKFIAKVHDFDYEIISEEESDDKDGKTVIVTVRIKTYDFGSEYLAVMKEFAEVGNPELGKDDDPAPFYDELFERFAKLDSKDYVKDVRIIAYSPNSSSEWVTNVKNNEELQDALLGGMTAEMRELSK